MNPPNPRKFQWISGLLLVLLYVLGLATGVGLTRWLQPAHGPGGPPPPPHHGKPPQLIDELNLTPEQDRQVRAIYDKHNPALEAVLRENFPRIQVIQDQVEREIRAILTPEQQRRLDHAKSRRRPRTDDGRPTDHGSRPPMTQGPLDLPPPPEDR